MVQQLKLELIRGYEEYVRTVACLTGTKEDEAREAFHTAFCRMLVGLKKRPSGNPIVAWRPYIIRSAINTLKEEARQVARRKRTCLLFSELDAEGKERVMSVPDPRPRPAEQAENNELATLAWKEMKKLPSHEREVIARRCQGESYKEIAKDMSIAVPTAGTYWTRGLDTLRARLRDAA